MIKFDYNYFMDEHIGGEHGISKKDIDSIEIKANGALKRMLKEKEQGKLGFLEIPFDERIVEDIRDFKKSLGTRFNTIALIGIGGSALGPQALKNSLSHLYLNELNDEQREGIFKVYFFDNVDPYEILSIRDVIDFKKTLFLVISKSGGTTEPNANFLILLDILKANFGNDYKDHIVTITDPEKGILRGLAEREGFKTFSIPQNVGGRFSVLSAVGIVMSEFVGINIKELLEGAKNVVTEYFGKALWENPPLLNASLHFLFDIQKNKRINVLMPYTRKLYLFADWYRQLWAESLGKNRDVDGKEVVVGLTPVSSFGAIDQHSQLQLYLEGPNDKVITFLKVENFEYDFEIPEPFDDVPEFGHLSFKSLRELNRFEESATELALKNASRPNASIILSHLKPKDIGEFIMFYEMQTAYAGYLYNINPYDQPAVEEGKKFTFGLLKRKGYEKYSKEFKSGYKKLDKYII
ncbi:MAG: glucose-6-phosphate isomerase [Spirochaetota bacterium]|nr:glucose-6-phosphate isomerase [Spirochaetota bacterium]